MATSERFTLTMDNRVLCHGYELGRVYEHANVSSPHKPGKWFAVHPDAGIVDITGERDRAALQVIRAAGYSEATLLDLDYEPADARG